MNKEKRAAGRSLYERLDDFAARNDKRIFTVLSVLCLVLSLISFNARISEAHDDALYLEGGWRFVHEFPSYFYTQNAPLYPMFLAVLIRAIGFHLIIFKLISVAFNFFGFVLLYKALRGRLPAVVFLPVVFFQATNYLILYFASMTFTEAFYFFLQGCFFFYAVKAVDITRGDFSWRGTLPTWILLGLFMFLISTAKSSAVVVVPAVALFFILEKNWKALALSVVSFLSFKIIYEATVRIVWGAQNQFKGQGRILLQKDPYDASLGNEDAAGFVQRFVENCNLAFSKRYSQMLGFLEESSTATNWLLTLIVMGLAIYGFWRIVKNGNRALLLLSLFTGAQIVLSYLILQVRWDQPRITLVCMPVMLSLQFYGIYDFSLRRRKGETVLAGLVSIIMISCFMSSLKRGMHNIPIVKRNLKGDKYYGYTPDWQNFLKCSEWCADSLPASALVVSRKAPMSFVYGKGKKFFPVYSVIMKDSTTNQSNPDSALAFFKKNKVTHVMLGSLRLNPNNASAGYINTIHNIVAPIMKKYPEKMKIVHIEGQFEEAYVLSLTY